MMTEILDRIALLALESGWPHEEAAVALASAAGMIIHSRCATDEEREACLQTLDRAMRHFAMKQQPIGGSAIQ